MAGETVDGVDGDKGQRAGRDGVGGEGGRRAGLADGEGDGGDEAEGFADYGVEVGEVVWVGEFVFGFFGFFFFFLTDGVVVWISACAGA